MKVWRVWREHMASSRYSCLVDLGALEYESEEEDDPLEGSEGNTRAA